jgi:prepilin-type N-terminal cleavage/methylation domain-containing protein
MTIHRHHRGSNRAFIGNNAGFTLIELAVAIFVIALILGSLVVPLSTQVDQRQNTEARARLEEIRDALTGHAVNHGYLPCPDTNNDGLEDVAAGNCNNAEGTVPWATLGVQPTDPWGNRVRYRVSALYARRAPIALTLSTEGTLLICSTSACGAGNLITQQPDSLNAAVAVLISHGPNGWGAIIPATGAQRLPTGCATVAGCAAMTANEIANANGDANFVSRERSPADSTSGEFDDIVLWLSPHVLKQRMVAAGRLP